MEKEIENMVKALKGGKTILYPTDTVWGIGCDATNQRAVEKVYKIKRRATKKNLIILLDDSKKLSQYIREVPSIAYDLIKNIDKPLTIIYPEAKNIAKNVVGEDKSIGIRIINDAFCKRLIKRFGKPIVSTSANLTGQPTPIVFSQISDDIKNKVDYIVNLHRKRITETKPSTIIKLEVDTEFKIIRE